MSRTKEYLFPIVRVDKSFTEELSKLANKKQIIDVYLGEYELDKDHLYIISKQPLEHESCICYKSILGAYVIKYPIKERFKSTVDNFIQGKYSKMYSSKTLNELLINLDKTWVYQTLTRDPKYIPKFINILKKANLVSQDFKPTDEWLQKTELDIPPKKSDLIWNT